MENITMAPLANALSKTSTIGRTNFLRIEARVGYLAAALGISIMLAACSNGSADSSSDSQGPNLGQSPASCNKSNSDSPVQGNTLTLLSGNIGSAGNINGIGSNARFGLTRSVAMDGTGSVYVADTQNHIIRKISPAGAVSTLAGTAGRSGSANGTGAAARFSSPVGIATDNSGNVYVGDGQNYTIRKISPTGVVSTLAGTAGSYGATDGTGANARFSFIKGVATDSTGNVFVVDSDNQVIRKISPSGVVTTFAGTAGSSGLVDGTGAAARFGNPTGIATDKNGNMFVTDDQTIRKISPAGVVTTFAGTAGSSGSADGSGATARFYYPESIAADNSGNVFVADTQNSTIRKIDPAGVVSTLAGTAGIIGTADGTGAAARFNYPAGIAANSSGSLFVADTRNSIIRKVDPAGVVSSFAGLAYSDGSSDGTAAAARFRMPQKIATDSSGNIFVADFYNNTIRKISCGGVVSTWAGIAGSEGLADGTGSSARFKYPAGIVIDRDGTMYVADAGNHTIRKISPAGVVSTLAGMANINGSADGAGAAARFDQPFGITIDSGGNVYVADGQNHTIRKINPAGVVTTLAGTAGSSGSVDGMGAVARFNFPTDITTDRSGNVYVADSQNHTIRKINPAGVVTTFAGTAGSSGSADGMGVAARLNNPQAIITDSSGNMFVADSENSTIRKISPAGLVTTVVGTAGSQGVLLYPSPASLFRPVGLAISGGKLFITTANAVVLTSLP
jgi:sugar lactone lactonase YvrE